MKEDYTNILKEQILLEQRINLLQNYAQSIKNQQNILEELLNKNKKTKEIMKETISTLKGIENYLYKSIIIEGLKPTKAVEKTSFKYDLVPSTIWRQYYPNVKKEIEKLSSTSDSPVIFP